MPTWLIGAVRAGLQALWALLVAAALDRGFALPADAPAWLDEAALGVVLALFVGLVQWMETRDETTVVGRIMRGLAKLLMLGVRKPVYPKREPEAVALLRAEQLRGRP